MGGKAFENAVSDGGRPISTPRISPGDYIRLRDTYLQLFQAYFATSKVGVLKEAPGKTDYGDIDFVVATESQPDFYQLAVYVGAAGLIFESPHMCSLAVNKDGTRFDDSLMVYKNGKKSMLPTSQSGIESTQIDIEIVPPSLLEWHLFYASYGDLGGLIGRIVTKLGFTLRNTGLFLRMKQLDDSKSHSYQNISDQDGSVFLSNNPRHVMEFLGLSFDTYDSQFGTVDELYKWLGTCPLLSTYTIQIQSRNSNERHRESKRSVYSNFFSTWLPINLAPNKNDWHHDSNLSEEDVINERRATALKEALVFFDKKGEYGTKHALVERKIDSMTAAFLAKPIVAQSSGKSDKSIRDILKGFRRFTGVGDDFKPYILAIPHSDDDSEVGMLLGPDKKHFEDPRGIEVWLKANWETLLSLERLRIKT
ncbi:Hypothetical protein R9X50_00673000 [Acrodontium crateriforme]|uniref:Uncharacterized protein n=1 Tax=Acrodontium crateriforme TaxID=150365 RepID=A0AAQ3MAC0_9PEZI|nr:Hypothetical protein R9X50_00673000 [Acrodontium crateriforme]